MMFGRAFLLRLGRTLPQIGSAASNFGFLEKRDATFAIVANLAPTRDPEPSLQGLIERVEDKRAIDEKTMFEQVCRRRVAQHGALGNLFAQGVGRTVRIERYRSE